MGIFSAAIALFRNGGLSEREGLLARPSPDEGEPKSTVLVIDDDPIVLRTVKSLLDKGGFTVLTSSSAPKRLDMLRYAAGGIRVVVLEYSMPKLNSAETLNFIKQLCPKAKDIGLTAMNLDSVPREYLEGVNKLLAKPVIASQLIGAINELLGDGQTASSTIQP